MTKEKKAEKTATESTRFSITETINQAKDKVSVKIKAYNDKYLAKTIEKGRQKAKTYNDQYVVKNVEKGKQKAKEYNEKYVSKTIEKGIADGRKIINKVPMVGTIEKKVTDGLRGVPSMINMPSKGEIEKLTLALENLNTNIETLKNTK